MLEGPGEEIRISRTKTGNLINTSLRSQSCVRGVAFSSMTGPLPHFRHRIKRSHQSNLSLSNTSLSQTSPPHFRHPLKRSHHSNLPAALSPPSQTSLSQTSPPHFHHPLKRSHHSNPTGHRLPTPLKPLSLKPPRRTFATLSNALTTQTPLPQTSLSQTSPPHFRHPLKRSHQSNLPLSNLSPLKPSSLKRSHHSNLPLSNLPAALSPLCQNLSTIKHLSPWSRHLRPRASFQGVSLVFGEGDRNQGRRRARPWHRTRASAPWAHGRSTGRRCDGDENGRGRRRRWFARVWRHCIFCL